MVCIYKNASASVVDSVPQTSDSFCSTPPPFFPKFTPILTGMSKLSYADRLQVLGIFSLEQRRIVADLIMCYKILNYLVDVDCKQYFKLVNCSGVRTRGPPRSCLNHCVALLIFLVGLPFGIV